MWKEICYKAFTLMLRGKKLYVIQADGSLLWYLDGNPYLKHSNPDTFYKWEGDTEL